MSVVIDPVVQFGVRVSFAFLFFGTALHKVRSLDATSAVTSHYLASLGAPVSPVLARQVTAALVVAELAAAGLAAAYPSGLLASGLIGALLTLYAIGMTRSLLLGQPPASCGCSWAGTSEQPAGWPLVFRNLVLVAVASLLLPAAAPRSLGSADYVGAIVLGVFGLAMYATVDVLLANSAKLRAGSIA